MREVEKSALKADFDGGRESSVSIDFSLPQSACSAAQPPRQMGPWAYEIRKINDHLPPHLSS